MKIVKKKITKKTFAKKSISKLSTKKPAAARGFSAMKCSKCGATYPAGTHYCSK